MFAVIVANIWYGVTFFAIMILAALQSVPDEMLEAASLDGAGKVRQLFSIIIPYISDDAALTILLRVIWIFNFPDIIYAMTSGGPANQTHIITTWMINYTQQGNYGLARAIGLIVVAFLFVFCAFYLMAMRRPSDDRHRTTVTETRRSPSRPRGTAPKRKVGRRRRPRRRARALARHHAVPAVLDRWSRRSRSPGTINAYPDRVLAVTSPRSTTTPACSSRARTSGCSSATA